MNDTNLTAAQPLDPSDMDDIEALSLAAPQVWYGTYQIADGITDEKAIALIEACSPDTILALIAQARASQPESAAAPKDMPESMAESNARFAIDGAIQYGRENRNAPPSADHWLYEYWNIGQQLRELGKTGWDNVTPLASQPPARSSCTTCDGSGTVHRADGEYMGECPCDGNAPSATGTTGASIDTPEFRALLDEFAYQASERRAMGGDFGSANAEEEAEDALTGYIDAIIGDLRAQLAASAQPDRGTAQDDRWQVVPKVPTKEMIDNIAAFVDGHENDAEVIYRAMLAAAPSPASQPVAPTDKEISGAEMHDVVHQLREYASNPGYSHNDYADTMCQAANCIESLRAMFWNCAVAPSDAKGKADAAATPAQKENQQ